MANQEHVIEAYLHQEIVKLKGYTYKWVSPNHDNVPDRIVMLKGRVWFMEIKTMGNKPTAAQFRELDRIKGKGLRSGWIEGKYGVNCFIRALIDDPEFNGFSQRFVE